MPNGEVPHLIQGPRSHRCDQHRDEYRKWKQANDTRRHRGTPELPWEPNPLTAANRKRAILELEKSPALLANSFTPDLAQVAAAQGSLAQQLAAILASGGLTKVQGERVEKALVAAKDLRDRLVKILMDMGMSPAQASQLTKPKPFQRR